MEALSFDLIRLKSFLSVGSAAIVNRRCIIPQVLVQPICHFAVQMIGSIILLA